MDLEIFDLFGEQIYCSICLTDIKEGERVISLKSCHHGFHEPCIAQWLEEQRSCPNCRKTVPLITDTHTVDFQRSILSWVIIDTILSNYTTSVRYYRHVTPRTRRILNALTYEGQKPYPLDFDTFSSIKRQKQILKERILDLIRHRSPENRIRSVHSSPEIRQLKQVVDPRLQEIFLVSEQ